MSTDRLSLYRNARRYDAISSVILGGASDLPFYRRQVERCGGPVLELACGTGRLAVPLALGGAEVTGLDLCPEMLAVARAQARQAGCSVRWVEGDVRCFDLPQRFALAFIAHNSFLHLTERVDLEACLQRVKSHLAPGGRFVLDVFNPLLEILIRDPDQEYPLLEYIDPDTAKRVVATQRSRYDRASQVNHIVWTFTTADGAADQVSIAARILYPQELDALLVHAGFEIEHKYGNYSEVPFESSSPYQIVVCRAA